MNDLKCTASLGY